MKESKIQSDFYKWFNAEYAEFRFVLFSVPNEMLFLSMLPKALQFRIMSMLKAMGMSSGVADMFFSVPRGTFHGLYIEFKTATGRQSDKQKRFEEKVKEQHYAYIVCRSSEEAKEQIIKYLAL